MTPAPSYLAGYQAGLTTLAVALVPPNLDERQRLDFVTGFLIGARERRRAEIVEAIKIEGFNHV